MRALVVGRSQDVWDEVALAKKLGHFDFTVVCNATGTDYPEQIDHWVTFHVLNIDRWVKLRQNNGFPPALQYWSSRSQCCLRGRFNTPIEFLETADGGSSGMLGVMCAKLQGATRIVCAGIPMERNRGWYNQSGPWGEAENYHVTWLEREQELKGCLRSMSGWTQRTFGAPTKEWFDA